MIETFEELEKVSIKRKLEEVEISRSFKNLILKKINAFFENHSKYVEEIFWIHRSEEYDDNGSPAVSALVYFKPTDIFRYLVNNMNDLQPYLQKCYHHTWSENFLYVHREIPASIKTSLRSVLNELYKIQEILGQYNGNVFPDTFGYNTETRILANGAITTREFEEYG